MNEDPVRRFIESLSGAYRFQRELNGGGMSRVFVASDRELDRDVVIKALPPDLMSADAVGRFRREMRTVARLQHPNIVPLLTAGEAGGIPYYTMPYVSGASLRSRLEQGRLSVSESIGVLADVARALAAAHAHGIAHRDVKPENVLLADGAALVTDFGVARALSEATATGDASPSFRTSTGISVGTPAYMAPEQLAADAAADHRADIYSWGLVAYELLAGQHPFAGLRGTPLLNAQLTTVPPAIETLEPAIPSSVAAIVNRAIRKDPAERPASAQELVDALARVEARPAGPRWSRRATLVAAVVLVTLAIPLVLLYSSTRPGTADERSIAIAPFRIGGASPELRYLREGLGDLITPQLQSIPGVKSPGMRTMLSRWRNAAGSVEGDLPDETALRVAAASGAGQLVLGDIVGAPSHVTIHAQLVRVSDGKVLAPATVEGPADSATAMAARLVATLLSIRDGETMDRVRNMMSAKPEAIAPFLAGERAYRHGRYADAIQAFSAAYGHDTTFALAALRMYTANEWLTAGYIPGPWLTRAVRHRDRLAGTDAALLAALTGPTFPAPTPPQQRGPALYAAAERNNTAELWYLAGDVALHRYSLGGDTGVFRRSLDAFRRAEALDSSFAPALEHQTLIYLHYGDTAGARAAWKRQRMLDSTGDFFRLNDLLFRASTEPQPRVMQAIDEYVKAEPHPLPLVPAWFVSDLGRGFNDAHRLDDADAFVKRAGARFGLTPDAGMQLVLALGAYHLNTGRPETFAAPPSRDSAPLVNELNVIAGLVWDGDPGAASRSAAELSRWTKAPPDSATTIVRSTAWLALGLHALSTADTATLEHAMVALRALPVPRDLPWLRQAPMIHEKLLAAHLAVARRTPDARARLLELDSLLINTTAEDVLVAELGNLLVSRLWETMHDDRRAFDAINRRGGNPGSLAFSSTRLRARARIAERLGDWRTAIGDLQKYVNIRAKASPALQPDLADARATLQRLQRQRRE